ELEPARIGVAALDDVGEFVGEMRLVQAAGREVDRYHYRQTVLPPAAALLERFLEHEEGQWFDEPNLLGKSDETTGQNHAVPGVVASDQRLYDPERAAPE